jgi:hypothetical protein
MRTRRRFGVAVLGAVVAAVSLLLGWAGQVRAAVIPLPTTLDQLLPAGNSAVVTPVPYTFSNFSYSTTPIGSPPSAANVTVSAFHIGAENGISFRSGFNALPGTTVEYALSYVVTAPAGINLTDALLSAAMGNFGGTGSVSIVELLTFPDGSSKSLEVSLPGAVSTTMNFAGVTSIQVQEDMFLNGGSLGAQASFVNNGFSSAVAPPVPEPSTLALLALGGGALAGWRRCKRKRFQDNPAT